MEDLINLLILLLLVLIGYIAGRSAEKKHYKKIVQREKEFLKLPAVTIKNAEDPSREIESSELVYGSVVISIDYFKRIYAGLINFFGGEVGAYETLLDRGRREAILRMKEMNPHADIISNLGIETTVIGNTSNSNKRQNSVGAIEVIAFGTAIKYS